MEQIFLTLVHMSLAAGWLVCAIIAARLVLKKAPRRILCLLWALAAIRLLCPAVPETRVSLVPRTETVWHAAEQLPLVPTPAAEAAQAPGAAPAESAQDTVSLTAVLSRVWLAGAAGMLLWTLQSDLRLRRRLRCAARQSDHIWLCDEIDTPFVLGVVRPRIYLPSDLDPGRAGYILAHERAHIARRDHWWKPLGWMLLCVYWFHPLLWLAYALFCRDLELACDERVAQTLDRAGLAAYCQALLDSSRTHRPALSCPLAFGEVGAKQRIRALAQYKKPAFWLVLVAVLAVIAAAILFLTTRPAAENALDYFEQYRANVLDGDAEAASALRWFENQTKRQMYLDHFQTPEAFIVTDQAQINDDLWVFSCAERLPELPETIIYQFVGRSGGRLWVYGNVNQIPEAISAGLDRSLYDYHEDENVMNADEDEQLKALEQADAKALIEAFPNTDGAYAELLLTRLAEYYLSDPEGVIALIEQYTLTEQQKKELLAGIENAFVSLDDSRRIYTMRADANGVIEVPDYGVVLTLPEGWAEQTVAVCDRSEDSIWIYLANERLMYAYEDDPSIQGQGWRDYILLVYAEKKWAHPEPPDYSLSGMTPVLIGETDSARVYASSERDIGHDTFLNLRDQFIQKIGQARYDELVGELVADPNQIQEYVHLRQA